MYKEIAVPFLQKGGLRVAAYCRVSTDGADQAGSLESQRRYFDEMIRHNPCWQLTGIYVDEGVSGTSTKRRDGFNRMLRDAKEHAFDLLLTKEISRFARNTLDGIYYTRLLKEWGIGVYFLNDHIFTLDADAELRLTILASIAQEESRKTSERVKWGQKRRMEQGVVFGRSLLGYDVKDGQIAVNEEGAAVVRRIFHKFLEEGKGCHTIAHELQEEGVPTCRAGSRWSAAVILRMLQNEKYAGDLVQKKTFTPNFLTHEKKYNRGEEPLVVLRGHHEPIISRSRFERVQKELRHRSQGDSGRKHSARYPLSGKIQCGLCGAFFVPRLRKYKDGSNGLFWRCGEAARYGRPRELQPGKWHGCEGCQLGDGELSALASHTLRSLAAQGAKEAQAVYALICTALGEAPRQIEQELQELAACDPPDGQFLRLLIDRMVVYQRERVQVRLQGCAMVWEWRADKEGEAKE